MNIITLGDDWTKPSGKEGEAFQEEFVFNTFGGISNAVLLRNTPVSDELGGQTDLWTAINRFECYISAPGSGSAEKVIAGKIVQFRKFQMSFVIGLVPETSPLHSAFQLYEQREKMPKPADRVMINEILYEIVYVTAYSRGTIFADLVRVSEIEGFDDNFSFDEFQFATAGLLEFEFNFNIPGEDVCRHWRNFPTDDGLGTQMDSWTILRTFTGDLRASKSAGSEKKAGGGRIDGQRKFVLAVQYRDIVTGELILESDLVPRHTDKMEVNNLWYEITNTDLYIGAGFVAYVHLLHIGEMSDVILAQEMTSSDGNADGSTTVDPIGFDLAS